MKPYQITPKGIARTFQNIRLFKQMSVLDNVLIGQHCRTRTGLVGAVLRTPRTKKKKPGLREHAMEMLSFVNLEEKKDEKALQPLLRRAAAPGDCPGLGHGSPSPAVG